MSHPLSVFGPRFYVDLTKETGNAKESLTLVVEQCELGLEMFESELFSHFDPFSDLLGDVELIVKLGQDIVL